MNRSNWFDNVVGLLAACLCAFCTPDTTEWDTLKLTG